MTVAEAKKVEPKFDANQKYQLDAIASVVDLFAGAQADIQGATIDLLADDSTLPAFDGTVYGNALTLASTSLQLNLRRVQTEQQIPPGMQRDFEFGERPNDFAIEMETGTGKTYVYLRTIAELHQEYGFTKFLIVVPSPAILETVVWSLEALKEHLKTEYAGVQSDYYMAYDSKKVTGVREFATSSALKVMVINIDKMNSADNIWNKPHEDLGWRSPREYVEACHPIVIMDEPQSLDGPTHVEAINNVSPIVKLRYSATHRREPKTGRYLQHLVHRLTPIKAYDLKLVKHINVLSITQDQDLNDAYVEIRKVTATGSDLTATAVVHKSGALETAGTQVTLRKDVDLREITGRDIYEGWRVEHIHAGDDPRVEFANGLTIRATKSNALSVTDQLQRLMIRQAIIAHLEKEADLIDAARFKKTLPAPLKPLTLFFVDEVANFWPEDGKFRVWFEEEYESLTRGLYSHIPSPPVEQVYAGRFSADNKGVPTKTQTAQSEGAKRAYDLIMKEKGTLLSPDEPLRFIFTHSALAEGWDNPNVFTICNFQTGKSDIRKRQQIGRGLRLPVMANGERCFDEDINQLTVIANESFAEFADALQKEIEQDTGEKFEKRITNARDRKPIKFRREVLDEPWFQQLWAKISARTTYNLEFSTDDVVANALKRINEMPAIEPVRFRVSKTRMSIDKSGLDAVSATAEESEVLEGARRIPDVVGEITRRVALSRATIVRILQECDRLAEVKVNPAVFIDQVVDAMSDALYQEVAKGIKYIPTGDRWEQSLFRDRHQKETISNWVVDATKTITDKVALDSGVEETFGNFLESRPDVVGYLKLPAWYKIDTPLGAYNPDWAIVREVEGQQRLYLVRETKGTADEAKLQWEHEAFKINFGRAHYEALEVDYRFGDKPLELIEPLDVADFDTNPDPLAFGGA